MVPYTLEGSYVLHQMMKIRWAAWKALPPVKQEQITAAASVAIGEMEAQGSAAYSQLGHKGDLMLIHFRRRLDELNQAELKLARLEFWDYLEPAHSYLSVVELGLYDSTARIRKSLSEQGLEPDTEAWVRAVDEELDRQRKAMEPRLFPDVPAHRYVCFYPMDRKRGESKNWYTVAFADRQRMMHDHGMVGRKYAGDVKQIISGSIGLDDWEWGVDLWSEDPLWFKKLIYEMRFDEVSAVYALFGQFFVGIRLHAVEVGQLLAGRLSVGRSSV
jgi:chlorite dismutase